MNKFKEENGRSLKNFLSEQLCRRNDKTCPLSQNKENQKDIDKNNPIVKVWFLAQVEFFRQKVEIISKLEFTQQKKVR